MTHISFEAEMTTDWDWFACDSDGNIGHFATAGMRRLPRVLREDYESMDAGRNYFCEILHERCGYRLQKGFLSPWGRLKNLIKPTRRFDSFIRIAKKGLFSYDAALKHGEGEYFLVAIPDTPLKLSDVPQEIQSIVRRLCCKFPFSQTPRIPEFETLTW